MTAKIYSEKIANLEKELKHKKSLRKNIAAIILFGLYILFVASAFMFIQFSLTVWEPNIKVLQSAVNLADKLEYAIVTNPYADPAELAAEFDTSGTRPFMLVDNNGNVVYCADNMNDSKGRSDYKNLSHLIPKAYFNRDMLVHYGEATFFQTYYEIDIFTPLKLCKDCILTPDNRPTDMNTYTMSSIMRIETQLCDGKFTMISKSRVFQTAMDKTYLMLTADVAMAISIIPLLLYIYTLVSSYISQKKLSELLYLDTATLGKNWLFFVQHAEPILRDKKNEETKFVVASLKAGKYRNYCTCFGNKEGELLLQNISNILRSEVRENEKFARHSKSEFGILLIMDDKASIEERVEELREKLTRCAKERRIMFSFGLYEVTDNAMPIDEMYDCASMAQATAAKYESALVWFNDKMKQEQIWERKVEDTMEKALKERQFKVYLQPKYCSKTHKILGAEALIRWVSPTDGFITPNKFIPIFERNGFIMQIDDYMLSETAKFQANRVKRGLPIVPISVNISRVHFSMPDFAEHICRIIDSTNVPRECIELELTESAFFDGKETLLKIIMQLKSDGFLVSMDDFGAGFSSLNSLKDLPLDILKLDMGFFRGDMDERCRIVVTQAIQLAKLLQMSVVAEGIETKEQVEFLAANSCDMIQGYYFAKPMPIEEFEKLLEKENGGGDTLSKAS